MIELNRIYNEDCLEGMKRIPDKSIDMILCDLPYGTTACKWDTVIPFEPLWEQYERIIKDNGAIVLFSSEPFTSFLVQSNIKRFKYKWIWQKEQGVNPLLSKKQPLNDIEEICVFYKKQCLYNPQFIDGKPYTITRDKKERLCEINNHTFKQTTTINKGKRYPKRILQFNRQTGLHPTQKPVALCEYLIKTYTNEGETVLDNCMGSGTTAVACINTNRNYIGFELDKHYCEIANERIRRAMQDNCEIARNRLFDVENQISLFDISELER